MAEINNEKAINENIENSGSKFNIKNFLLDNMVTILFVVLCIAGTIVSKLPLFFIANELLIRLTRNSFLVLALIIPVLAGMGLNFSIVIGAMAAQIAIIIVTHLGIGGIPGFLLCALLALPIAIVFGILIGKLLNKTKGQEMIASMITGFFANGLYYFLFLFLVGTLIPMKNEVLMLSSGIGIRNTINLKDIMYSIDNIVKIPFFVLVIVAGIVMIAYGCYKLYVRNKNEFENISKNKQIVIIAFGVLIFLIGCAFTFYKGLPNNLRILNNLKVSAVTALIVTAVCVFNVVIVKTKLGQDFRTVGQDKHIAAVSGINVNKTRLIAITISTVLAAWGQLIFLQNLGTLNTYGSHVQIATFAIASILIGGASVSKATVGQALLGVLLFHTLFVVSPRAAMEMFGDAQIAEFFRNFVSYGVIGLSLGLHAWRKAAKLARK